MKINLLLFSEKIRYRLKGYDYSQAGMYFVTICCQNRQCVFGEIENGEMVLNNAGKMIENSLRHRRDAMHCVSTLIHAALHFIHRKGNNYTTQAVLLFILPTSHKHET